MSEEIIVEHDSKKIEHEKFMKLALTARDKREHEIKELVNCWGRTSLLDGFEHEYIQGEMALLLENQRLINEISTDSGDMAQFKRISIPLVRRVFDPKACLAWELVSLQTALGPTAYLLFQRPDGDHYEEIAVYTRRIKCLWQMPTYDNIREQHDLDKEADMTAVLAIEICNEINEEIIGDLSNNVGIHEEIKWKDAESLWSCLQVLFDSFEQKFGKKPNWIVANKALATELKKHADFESSKPEDYHMRRVDREKLTCRRTGTLNKDIVLVECDYLLPHDILVGYKDGHCGSGYVYAPYVPFTRTPVVLDPQSFEPKVGLLTRYGKRLSVGGSQFYAKLTVRHHQSEVVENEKEAE